jgi:hypothetical protein
MSDRFDLDVAMQEFVANGETPPAAIKASIHKKLIVEQRRQGFRQGWFASLGITVFSAAGLLVVSTFTSSVLALGALSANAVFAIAGSVVLTAVSRKEIIRGDHHVVLD